MKTPAESVAYVKHLASEADVRTPHSKSPLAVSSQVTAKLVPDGPYSSVLPTDVTSLRLLAFAAQLQGQTLVSEATAQAQMVDGVSWLRVSALAAFISGAETNRAKDHLLAGSIFHRMGEADLAEGEFMAAHNTLTATGHDSRWDLYGSASPDEKDELADAATALQDGAVADVRLLPAEAELPANEPVAAANIPAEQAATGSGDRNSDVVQDTVDRGARASLGRQDKLSEFMEGDTAQSPVYSFGSDENSTEKPTPEPTPPPSPSPAASAPEATAAPEPDGTQLPSVASILSRPFTQPDNATDSELRQELLSYPPTTAGVMMRDAYEQSQAEGADPVLGQYFANHEYEAYQRVDLPVGMSHALARLALSRRNGGRGDQQALYEAFETTKKALDLVEGFPAFPDLARPSLPYALLFLDAGQPHQAIQQLTPMISAGEDLLDRTGTLDQLLADLYTVRSKAFSEQLSTTGSDDDRRRISEDYTRATELYTLAGQPDGFEKARQRYLI